MTIGVAAAGPGAGRAILEALAAVEGFATGAVGGFLSFAALDAEGRLRRAAVQRGGARALLASGTLARAALAAPRAVLMSSGPDRPEPLAQFTPAREGVGLVTGHRFPNGLGRDGRPLGEAALEALAAGADPDASVRRVLDANPDADAGLIVLAADGRLALADSAYVARFPDRGAHREGGTSGSVAVLHNAIRPRRSLAPLIGELVRERLVEAHPPMPRLELASGIPVGHGRPGGIVIDAAARAIALHLPAPCHGSGPCAAGFGPGAPVLRDGVVVGHAAAEPFLVVRDGRLETADGARRSRLPFVPVG